MVRSHLEFMQQSIDSLDSKLDELTAPYEKCCFSALYHSRS